jgi:uncharacterized protein YjiS (DUF1127 family)
MRPAIEPIQPMDATAGEMKMATIELFQSARDEAQAASREVGFLSELREAVRAVRRRVEERRTIARLSRLSPHLIRDMGLDPDAIRGALIGTWDEVHEDRFPKV